jgi:hypothetical protein
MGFTPEQEQEYRAQEDALAAITKLLHETTLAANEAARKDRQQHNEQAKTRSLDRWSPAKAQAGDEGDEDDAGAEDDGESEDAPPEDDIDQDALDAHNQKLVEHQKHEEDVALAQQEAPPAPEQPTEAQLEALNQAYHDDGAHDADGNPVPEAKPKNGRRKKASTISTE